MTSLFIILIVILSSILIFGLYMLDVGIQIKERNEKIYKLVEELRDRLDLHKL